MVIRTVKNMLMVAIKEIYSVYMYPIPHHIPGGYINCAIYITRTPPLSAAPRPEKHLMVSRQVLIRYTVGTSVYRGAGSHRSMRMKQLLPEVAAPRFIRKT